MELFTLAFAALFSVINPFGTVPIFVSLTENNTKPERIRIALWTSFNVLVILLVSFFAGKYILQFFGISLNALRIAGGLIITSSGFSLLTGSFVKHKGMKKKEKMDAQRREAISLTPLALPMLAGPGTISLLISYQQEFHLMTDQIILVITIVFTSCTIYLVLRSSFLIVKGLGASGLNALSRIIGFIVIAIGVEYIINGSLGILEPFLKGLKE